MSLPISCRRSPHRIPITQFPPNGPVIETSSTPASDGEKLQQTDKKHEEQTIDWDEFRRMQSKQKRLSVAEAVRTVVHNAKYGVLSAISARRNMYGAPVGSYVNYVADDNGRPIFSVTTMADHTTDMFQDHRVSLFVLEGGQLNAREQMVTITGVVKPLVDTEAEAVRAFYLKKEPGSFWVDFGDFRWFKLETIYNIRYMPDIQNFARNITGEAYMAAQPDPIAVFSPDLVKDVNANKSVELKLSVEAFLGFSVEKAQLKRVDRCGCDLICSGQGKKGFACRMPFKEEAISEKDLLREMEVLITLS